MYLLCCILISMTYGDATTSNRRYIKGLDGLRAIAVIAVLAYHLFPHALPGGYIGVDVFFVISGFLITTLLLTEKAKTGSIHFKKFWYRRARRLLPALFAVILVASAAALFIRGDILVDLGRYILGAATFSNNWMEISAGANYFDANTTHLFTNFWSLAVEEQFYVIWPVLLAGALGLSVVARKPFIGTVACIILATGSAVLMAIFFTGSNATRVYYGTDTHIFGLMVGGALAFWAKSKVSDHALRRLAQPFSWLAGKWLQVLGMTASVALILLMATMSDTLSIAYQGGLLLASILTAAVIVAVVSKRGILQRILTTPILEWIGARSYGIYLWHWPLLVLLDQALPRPIHWIIPGLTIIGTLGFAAISYRYLEVPIQEMGFRAFLNQGMQRRAVRVDSAVTHWRLRPHPMLIGGFVLMALTIGAIVSAPTKTQAQLSIETGQQAMKQSLKSSAVLPSQTSANSSTTQSGKPQPSVPITGANMTVVGDSVTIASVPTLQAHFPGILIDAEISRSLREGGFAAIDKLTLSGELRDVVVIALSTNGYFGTGNLDKLIEQLGKRKIIFVTAHAVREWTEANNADVHTAAKKYPHVAIAEWDVMIKAHPEGLSSDDIHPTAAGGEIYTASITEALKKFR